MKIKKTVEMTLPQLIEWAWENDITNKTFVAEHGKSASFVGAGNFNIGDIMINKSDIFKVDIVEEINENTELDLVEIFMLDNDFSDIFYQPKMTISKIISENHKRWGIRGNSKYFYLLNDDGTIGQLIWKDGEMIE